MRRTGIRGGNVYIVTRVTYYPSGPHVQITVKFNRYIRSHYRVFMWLHVHEYYDGHGNIHVKRQPAAWIGLTATAEDLMDVEAWRDQLAAGC